MSPQEEYKLCPDCEVTAYDQIFKEYRGEHPTDNSKIHPAVQAYKDDGWEHMINHAGMYKRCDKCSQM